jgi:putative tricarboxylic transport membrane protein
LDAFQYLAQGLSVALQPINILFAFFGCLLGTLVGVLPGIGPISGVALLIPVSATMTSGMPVEQAATSSIIMLAGV